MIKVKIADIIIEIESRYKENELFLQEYVCNEGEPNFKASCSEKEVEDIIAVSEIKVPAYCENAGICRDIAEKMIDYNRFLFHSANIEVDGKAIAFTAKSGVGKSTHLALWLKNFKDCKVLNGDKPFFHFDGQEFYVYGSPWQGKENAGYNGKAKLGAICFLKRGEKNEIKRISADDAFKRMFLQVSFPYDIEHRIKLTELLHELSRRVDCYELSCTISDEAALLSRKEIKL
ncbi:MAG: hypothetical protein ACI4MS_02325 [Candidatus Coproplasma sp.]